MEETADKLIWVHIGIASDAVFRVTHALDCKEQLAGHAAAETLRSRALKVVYPDGLMPDESRRALEPSFWGDSLALVRRPSRLGRTEWLGGGGWAGGIVESAVYDEDTMIEPMHYKAHGVEFCAQDLVKRYPFDEYVVDALLQGKAPPAFRPIATAYTPPSSVVPSSIAPPDPSTTGLDPLPRKRGAQWDDWIAALAVCVAEGEIFGNTRQSDALKAISDRMALDGIDEMARGTVATAIAKVLQRLNDNGNLSN